MKRIMCAGCMLSMVLGCAAPEVVLRAPASEPPPVVHAPDPPKGPTTPPAPEVLPNEPSILAGAPKTPKHAVELIPLPTKTVSLQALGENRGRIYAVSADNEVLEISRSANSSQVKSLGGPVCREPFFMDQTREPELTAFHFEGDKIQLWGSITRAGRGSWLEAYGVSRAANGRWSCSTYAPDQIVSVSVHGGAYVYRAMRGMFGVLGSLAGLPPIPAYDYAPTFYARSPTSIWAIQSEAGASSVTAYQYNGAYWQEREAPPLAAATAIFEDSDETLWILGTDAKSRNRLMRWSGRGWSETAIPADFSASMIVGTSPANIWFIGEKRWYGLEEGQLVAMDAPFAATAVWSDEAGDIWIAGRQADSQKDAVETKGSLARIIGAPTGKDDK